MVRNIIGLICGMYIGIKVFNFSLIQLKKDVLIGKILGVLGLISLIIWILFVIALVIVTDWK